MSFALTLVLSSLILPAYCQFSFGDPDGFHPDPLTTGTFALLCIFAITFGALIIWTFITLFLSRGHRSPYAFLLPALVFFAWSNAAYMAEVILDNIPALSFSDSLPVMLYPTLVFVSSLLNDWGVVLQFLAVLAVIWNRESALRVATEGKFGGHYPALTVLHAVLAGLTFILGTAAEGYNMDTNVRYYISPDFLLPSELDHRIIVYQQLFYAYTSFAILTAIDVVVSTALLWRAWKNAAIPDKITNILLYAVVPIYSLLSLAIMIFTIMFSPSGIPNSASLAVFEGANLASQLLINGLSIAVIFTILIMSTKKANWNAGNLGTPLKQQYWAPQPQHTYAAQYGAAHEASPGSYTPASSYAPASPPPMHASPGGYTPPQSSHGQPVQYPEKTGFA
ncbi:hypothetical protein DFH09DRAFT_1273744 [Mycena vulgaris]|nr:hypothetical protein DFH09DRAFT_1273744 [Mycena vulgaris]